MPNLDPSYYYKFRGGHGWIPYGDDSDEWEDRRRRRLLGEGSA